MRTFKIILFTLFLTIAYSQNILSISNAEIDSGESIDLDISLSNHFGKWIFADCKGRLQDSYIRDKEMKYHVYEGMSHRDCLFYSSKLDINFSQNLFFLFFLNSSNSFL